MLDIRGQGDKGTFVGLKRGLAADGRLGQNEADGPDMWAGRRAWCWASCGPAGAAGAGRATGLGAVQAEKLRVGLMELRIGPAKWAAGS